MADEHVVVCVLGGTSPYRAKLCSFFAKKSHSEGLEMYHRKGVVQTLLNPATYPERLNHMLAAVGLSDACILNVAEGFGWAEGESALALGHAGVEHGVVATSRMGPHSDTLSKMLAGTAAERFGISELDGGDYRKLDLDSFSRKVVRCTGNVVSVDNVFNVKGVGTVALGFVVCGRVIVHDVFKVAEGREVRVQSIQVMDEDVEEASAGTRVGLALKGATEKELGDQFFLGDVDLGDEIEGTLVLDKYYRQGLEVGKTYHLAAAGQVVPSTLVRVEGEKIVLKLVKPIPPLRVPLLLANMNLPPKTLRIVGHVQL